MSLGVRSRISRVGVLKFLLRRNLSPTRIVIFGFLALILLGTFLLLLPVATNPGQHTDFLTALFTSTSAVCVNGLAVVDTYTHWSVFGQCVILFMVQCGGLGFMSLAAIFSFMLRRTITLRERLVMTQSLNINDLSGIVRLTQHVLVGTLFCELSGAIVLAIRFSGEFGWKSGIVKGIFHSVSAFCNAGFDLMGVKGEFSSLTTYANDPIVNITIMSLVIVGGLGFIVWEDIYYKRYFREFDLHTKLVLVITVALLVGGSILFFLFEYQNPETLGNLPAHGKVFGAMFHSTMTRSAGFNTFSISAMTLPSKMLSILLMFIGGSSGSTAGGIKTVTFGVLILTAYSVMRGRNEVTAFGRRIKTRAILNALALTMTALVLVIVAALLMSSVQSLPLMDILFECFSAFGTTGLSTGITRELTTIPSIIIIALMFFGRVGILTISLGLVMNSRRQSKISLPEGQVLIG